MKIAFITSRFPYPVEKGDKLRAYQHLKWLGARHEVFLFAITHHPVREEDIAAVKRFCADVKIYPVHGGKLYYNLLTGLLNGLPASVAYFFDRTLKERMQEDLIRLQPHYVFAQLIRVAEYVRVLPVPKTLDYMDAFSFGASQRAHSSWLFLRPFYKMEMQRLRKYESKIYADFTNHVIISEQDRDRLPLPYQRSVQVLSNGVDLEYFRPIADVQKEYEVIFVGNLGYLPNIEAAEYLVRKVMPLVWRHKPGARICLAGARPHSRVQRLASPRVTISGWVEDVRPYYAKGQIFAAPMFSGMGQQNKILEAMAMGLPCITTPLVDKPIGAGREDAVMIAEDHAGFASAICKLLDDRELAARYGSVARVFASCHYSWEMKNYMLETLFTGQTVQAKTEPIAI